MKSILSISLIILTVGFAFAQSDIKRVDFNNFTYTASCGSSETQNFTVTKGTYFRETLLPVPPETKKKKKNVEPAPRYERSFFKPFAVVYGDVNGDGTDEAVVLTTCSRGGIESFSEGFVFGIKDAKPELLTKIEGGDRALGGLRDAKISQGIISVNRSKPGAFPDACCAEYIETTNYRYENSALTQVGEKTSVEIYPPMPIQMSGSPSQSTFNVSIPFRDKFKRVLIRAEKGQVFTVSTSSPNAKIRLFSGLGEVILNPKPIKKGLDYAARDTLTAKANETGDFVIEIANLSDTKADIEATVKVELN